MSDWNLSEKMQWVDGKFFMLEDVKEFIKLLKEQFAQTLNDWEIDYDVKVQELDKIDKLSGKDLI